MSKFQWRTHAPITFTLWNASILSLTQPKLVEGAQTLSLTNPLSIHMMHMMIKQQLSELQ